MRCSMSEFAHRFEDLSGQTPHIEEALQIKSTERRRSCNRYKHPVYNEKDRRSVVLLSFSLR